VAVRNGGDAALATQCTAIKARHLGRGAGLVDEHQPGRVELRLRVAPGCPCGRDVGPLLLAGVRRFF
jgi:hypothetical protein